MRPRRRVEICDEQFRFMPGRSITYVIFALRMVIENFGEGQKGLYCVSTDIKKAYDRVPRDKLLHENVWSGREVRERVKGYV